MDSGYGRSDGFSHRWPTRSTGAREAQRLSAEASMLSLQRVLQQIPQPERLRQPAAAALLEKPLGLGAGDIAGHEDDALSPHRG